MTTNCGCGTCKSVFRDVKGKKVYYSSPCTGTMEHVERTKESEDAVDGVTNYTQYCMGECIYSTSSISVKYEISCSTSQES